jgi:hypothetical protein
MKRCVGAAYSLMKVLYMVVNIFLTVKAQEENYTELMQNNW